MAFSAIARRLLKVRPRRGGGVSSYFSGDVAAIESMAADIMAVTGTSARAAFMAAVEASTPDRLTGSGSAVFSSSRSLISSSNIPGAYRYGRILTLPPSVGLELAFRIYVRATNTASRSALNNSTIGTAAQRNDWQSTVLAPYTLIGGFPSWYHINFLLDGHNNNQPWNGTFSLGFHGNGRPLFLIGDGAAAQARVGGLHWITATSDEHSILDGNWHCLELLRHISGGSCTYYGMRNGLQFGSEVGSNVDMRTFWNAWSGYPEPGWYLFAEKQAANNDNAVPQWSNFKGNVGRQIQLFSRRVELAESAADYNKTVSVSTAGLAGLYELNEGGGILAQDSMASPIGSRPITLFNTDSTVWSGDDPPLQPGGSSGGGTLRHGEEFEITGSGFGTRGHFGPTGRMSWAELEFDGASIAEDGWNFNVGGSTHWQHISDSPRNSRSPRWARRFNPDSGNSNIQYLRTAVTHPAASSTLFWSTWMLTNSASSGKTIRVNCGGMDLFLNIGQQNVAGDTIPTQWGVLPSPPTGSSWRRVDLTIMGRSAAAAQQAVHYLGLNSNNPVWSAALSGFYISGATNPMLGAGLDVGNMFWGFDSVYVDFTRARVELANSATWSAVTYSEIQTPITWADGKIKIRGRLGAFNNQQAWAYVFRDDGVRMPAIPVMTGL